jgi:DNA-binding transcriptional LysR family regulator
MRGLNLDYLRTFVAVVEHGGFSAAATRLGLTQPAVSLQIRQLEKRLGVRLIERVGRGTRPTPAGAELLHHAGRIEGEVAAALDAVARHASGTMGLVRLGTGATACIFLLPPLLRELRERFPDLEITVSTGNTADIVRAVEENTLDIALVTMPASGRILEIQPVMEEEFVAIAPPGTVLPDPATPAALAEMPLLLFEPGGNTRRIVDQWFAAAGIQFRPAMSLGSVEAIKELVAAGLGCSILPASSVSADRREAASPYSRLSPPLHRTLASVMRRDKPLTRGIKEMLRALERLAPDAPASRPTPSGKEKPGSGPGFSI